MKAVAFQRYGGPDVLRVHELPDRHADPGEVRIRVRAAAVSPADSLIRTGAAVALLQGPPPHIPGLDAAGVVDEMGPGTRTRLAVGDHVIALVNPTRPAGGAYAEHVVLPAAFVVKAPRGTDHAHASTLPLNGLTARRALDLLDLAPGQVLAVTGAAGGVGGFAVQLAKAQGLTVVADASAADEPLVSALGADAVVRRGREVAERIREVVPGGADGLLDAAAIGGALPGALRDGGAMAVVRGPAEPEAGAARDGRGITFHSVYVHTYDGRHDILDRLARQAEEGTLTLRVARTYPMEQADQAHRALEGGGIRGRLVLDF
ncbi:NADPH:quinone reductase [Actinacidiphila yanglinensis]|uniref:NADPH:quinone reductase n=1 Tax=Actinacidiphila yanglinensis TaxID=310779 RepID=A0A1H6DAS3_9ACTN|nr:NADP-dependent oxidoreductase [Actinacidiphila yanglinensis]SEG82567.1 NADPH:quinone reductase [Actinacidiphila yanglinensis]